MTIHKRKRQYFTTKYLNPTAGRLDAQYRS